MAAHDADAEVLRYLRVLVALQLRAALREDPNRKPQSLLKLFGLSAREAAGLLGKSEAAVAKAMQRAKA